tara:strand:+ start:66848 stop:67375 length:528 start_codon:yes stop_codon:yes gene_type:complete
MLAGGCSKDSETESSDPAATPPSAVEAAEPAAKPEPPPAKPAAAAMTTVELDGLGYVIDASSDWPVKKLGEGIFTFRLKPISVAGKPSIMPSLTVTKVAMGADTVEALVSRCKGTSIASGTKDAAIYHNCESEMAGLTIRTAEYVTKIEDQYLTCSASGLDFDVMNKVCSSLRKK